MNKGMVFSALLSLLVACSDAGDHATKLRDAALSTREGEAAYAHLPQQMQDEVARSSNEFVLSGCRDGATYDAAKCKQHLRGRMMRFGCELTVSYDELRTRWIASYKQPARYTMMPDDAFFAFLEDEDFCEPKQPDPSTNNVIMFSGADAWSEE